MGNSFLEEQLRRVKQLTEWMAQAHSHVVENAELLSRDRNLGQSSGPLEGEPDYRVQQSHQRDQADDRPRRTRPNTDATAPPIHRPHCRKNSRRKRR